MLAFTIHCLVFLLATKGSDDAVNAEFDFQEQAVEFRNGDIRLAGSLLWPESGSPVPAVIFVHGAGRHTRKSLREVGQHFANSGIAALIYDKRGTGESDGVYESSQPYTNLVHDALAGVNFLKHHPKVEKSHIGIWGLSQGAYISAAAARRTKDIKFVITVGASVSDGSFFYYCDNLFRKHGLSDDLRDVAAKAHFAKKNMGETLRHGLTFSSRSVPSPDQHVHPEWSHVSQPVLAMWGDLDQNVPVGESVAGMKNSLARANNDRWTIVILPKANHDLGISETGELQSKWRGYATGALKTMTDWAYVVLSDPSKVATMSQKGVARDAGILARYAGYEQLRWYGNATVQAAHWLLFFTVFLTNTIVFAWRLRGRKSNSAPRERNRFDKTKDVLAMLNLVIMIALTITILLVIDQVRPSCPAILTYLPFLGTLSTFVTVALLVLLAQTRRPSDWTVTRRIWDVLDKSAVILFVPFLIYWNVIGLHF